MAEKPTYEELERRNQELEREVALQKRVEEALRERQDKYQYLLKHAPVAIYELDFVNRKFKSVNDVMCHVLGYTEEEFLSMDPLDILDDDGKRTVMGRFMKILAGEKVDETVEVRISAKDGRNLWCVLNNAFIYKGGRITGSLVVACDITYRRKMEEDLWRSKDELELRVQERTSELQSTMEDLRRYCNIVSSTRDAIALLDKNYRYGIVNETYEEFSGIEREHFIGRSVSEYLGEDVFHRLVKPHFDRCLQGETVRYQEWFDFPKAGRKLVEVSYFPYRDNSNQIAGVVANTRDITERKRIEELQQSNVDLESSVKARTAELERKNKELQEFAFIASHDLSEPLRKIQTFCSLLESKGADHLNEVEKQYVSRMSVVAKRMQELLDALLKYSRIESRGCDFIPVQLNKVVHKAASDLEVVIRNVGAHVEIGTLPILRGDPYQLQQLFQNLLGNALKYHRSEVNAAVKVYGEQTDEAVSIFVEDNGIGFDEQYLDKSFQPFQRLHGKHEYPGTGIGLSVCKKIVERHGGTITAKSTPGKGSTFIVTLPGVFPPP